MATNAVQRSRVIAAMDWVFEGHRAPAFMLALVLLYKALLLAVLFTPNSSHGLGAFAEEFKVWCFGYDPATGKMQLAAVAVMFAEPLALGGAIVLLWGRSLFGTLRRRPRALLPSFGAAFTTVAIASAAFGSLASNKPMTGELPFPAEELRTSFNPPKIDLINQNGDRVSLDAFRGKVVLITGIYSSCSQACPMIMAQTRRAMSALAKEERDQIVVLAVTLDPEHDDLDRRAHMAKGLAMSAPQFNVLGGDPAEVNRVLDDLSIARKRDPETGAIDHTSVFAVIDKKGRLAYRFTVGERQEQWLTAALRVLGKE
jgi:protein SCO1/2